MKHRISTILALLILLSSFSIPSTPVYAASATVNVLATNANGTPTGINVTKGQPLTFQASGYWCSGGIKQDGSPSCGGPEGIRPADPGETVDLVLPNQLIGLLIGRIGNWVFPIGSSAQIVAQASGQLYLLMNDRTCCYADNSGQVSVTVSVGGGAVPQPIILHADSGFQLNNGMTIFVDAGLTTVGVNMARVNYILFKATAPGTRCAAFATPQVQIFSQGKIVWERVAPNPPPTLVFGSGLTPSTKEEYVFFQETPTILVARGNSYIRVGYATGVSFVFDNCSDQNSEIGFLQLNIP